MKKRAKTSTTDKSIHESKTLGSASNSINSLTDTRAGRSLRWRLAARPVSTNRHGVRTTCEHQMTADCRWLTRRICTEETVPLARCVVAPLLVWFTSEHVHTPELRMQGVSWILPLRAMTLLAGFMMALSAEMGRRMGLLGSAMSMMTTCACSPTFSRMQMNLSDSMVRVLNPMLAGLIPRFWSWDMNTRGALDPRTRTRTSHLINVQRP